MGRVFWISFRVFDQLRFDFVVHTEYSVVYVCICTEYKIVLCVYSHNKMIIALTHTVDDLKSWVRCSSFS